MTTHLHALSPASAAPPANSTQSSFLHWNKTKFFAILSININIKQSVDYSIQVIINRGEVYSTVQGPSAKHQAPASPRPRTSSPSAAELVAHNDIENARCTSCRLRIQSFEQK